jgi:preprotein translocase subunit SecE
MGRSAPIIKPDNVFVRYFKDTRAEIAKVTWPTREEGIRLTWVVLVVTVISALILSGLDLLFSTIVVFIVGAH